MSASHASRFVLALGARGMYCKGYMHTRTTHTRKVNASAYGLSGRWATVEVLPATTRGANARGTSASKRGWGGSAPKGAKRAKRQGGHRMGGVPVLRSSQPLTLYGKPSKRSGVPSLV